MARSLSWWRTTRRKLGAVFNEVINEQLILLFLDMDMALAEFTKNRHCHLLVRG